MSDVQGVILAAGRGSRLRILTESRPKALVHLRGKPLLEWQLLALRTAGVTDVSAVGGYRGDALAAYLPVIQNVRWQSTNMVYSMLQFPNATNSDVIISYSDIVYSSYGLETLLLEKNDVAITYDVNWSSMWSARFAKPLEDAESFRTSDGKVLDIGRKVSSLAEICGQFMGLVKFSARGWADCIEFVRGLPPAVADTLDMTGLLHRLVGAGRPVAAVPYQDPWGEVDSERDLTLYEEDPRFAPLRAMLSELASFTGHR